MCYTLHGRFADFLVRYMPIGHIICACSTYDMHIKSTYFVEVLHIGKYANLLCKVLKGEMKNELYGMSFWEI